MLSVVRVKTHRLPSGLMVLYTGHLEDVSPAARSLLEQLLQIQWEARICCSSGAGELRRHAFFAGFNWDALAAGELIAPLKPLTPVSTLADDQSASIA